MKDELGVLLSAIVAEAELKRPVRAVRFLYLPLGAAGEVRWEPEREDLEAAAEKLKDLSDEIVANEEILARPGAYCRWCAFATRCPDKDRVTLDDLVVPDDLPF